jgi:hypothetical protein
MFQRLVLLDSAALYTIAAFCVAVSIFATVTWRAALMRLPQQERLARLPLETETASSPHEGRKEPTAN